MQPSVVFFSSPGNALRFLMAVASLSLLASTLPAQSASASCSQQFSSVQQQIDAKNTAKAREQLAQARKSCPADAQLENLLGQIEVLDGHDAQARQAFRAALKRNPRMADAAMNLSLADMQTADRNTADRAEALQLTRQLLTADPKSQELRFRLATLEAWSGRDLEALHQLDRLSPEAGSQPQVQALACATHAHLGQKAELEKSCRTLATNSELTEPDAATCLDPLRKLHRADLIALLYSAAAQHQPLSPAGHRTLGLAQEAEGKLAEARATLEAAFTASQGKDAQLLTDLTRIAEAAGDDQGALGYLAHARDLAPADPTLPYEFGRVSLRQGFFGEARKAFVEALRLAPESAENNYALGSVISFSQDPSQALPYLEKFHALRPADPAGPLALGVTSFRSKDYESARRWLTQAAESPKTSADAHYYLGRIARQENRAADAVAEQRQALSLDPNRADILAELGQLALAARDNVQAADYLNRALALEPDNYAANFGLLQLYARTADPRREQQSQRFDKLKDQKEERDRLMMRVIEIRKDDPGPAPRP